ncbi:S9 family peptidase [Lignipirellula cremea]|uniref:Prolyl tripeptidyl peptidase n=1 Tax=Lignipirellula cremea TaxID=2528010 RepID=A0A518E0U5_9BACT|nr:S9 family peptidase [Lignipirellula cremea]QDU97708.1 Prolyl tripeptidyl peptidase precursor [Lignipirellula cremea]
MHMLPPARRLLILALLFSPALAARAEEQPVTVDDLYRFDQPASIAAASDGKTIVFERRWADRNQRQERHSLWQASDAAAAHPLEAGEPDARSPIYSPDGKWILFTSTRPFPGGERAVTPVPPYSDPATDIWLMPAAGGVAIPLGGKHKPYGRVFTDGFYGGIVFSPEGDRLAFIADDGRDPRTPAEIANNVQIVREDQGEGYEGYGPAQVWIADLDLPAAAADRNTIASAQIHRVTNDQNWYGDPQWEPAGHALIVHANTTADRESVRYSINKNFDLWRLHDLPPRGPAGDVARPATRTQLTFGPGPEVSPRLSSDGRSLLCLSIPRRGSHFDVFNLLLLDLGPAGGAGRVLFDHHGPAADQAPHQPPSFPLPEDCWLSPTTIYTRANVGVDQIRQVIDLTGSAPALPKATPESVDPARAAAAQTRRRLAPPSNPFLQDRRLASSEIVRWKSFDGLEVEGLFTPPADPSIQPPYPLALYPHGGPHSRSSQGFHLTVQVLAANGYAVFQPNYRGSAGYGQKYINADRFDLGGGDMRDILTGIDMLVAKKRVDPKRQFIYGSSYGGFTTCWLIGQTNQFCAAVPQNAVTDLTAMWGLSDIQSWTEWEFGGRPWETPQAMREHSPLTYVANVKTPTLILHSQNDRRVPLPLGRMYYRALQSQGVESQMVIYPSEGHGIRSLPHQEDVLRRVLDWFQRHDPARQP